MSSLSSDPSPGRTLQSSFPRRNIELDEKRRLDGGRRVSQGVLSDVFIEIADINGRSFGEEALAMPDRSLRGSGDEATLCSKRM